MSLSKADTPDRKLLKVLDGQAFDIPPIWIMRQAGRYLPEYRELRAKAPSFMDFCYNPAMAAEATLQPIRRYGFDGAILFSDILVIPDALGQAVSFHEGEGPRLDPLTSIEDAKKRLSGELDLNRLAPVFETIERVRGALPQETTFLGFCGAPWTVAGYMIAGKSTPELAPSRLLAYRDPEFLQFVIDQLVEASIRYLVKQLRSGVDAVQIFESFAGALTSWFRRVGPRLPRFARTSIASACCTMASCAAKASVRAFRGESNATGKVASFCRATSRS